MRTFWFRLFRLNSALTARPASRTLLCGDELESRLSPARYRWVGDGLVGLPWTTPGAWELRWSLHWSPTAAVPGTGDDVEFSRGVDCIAPTGLVVDSIRILPGYNGVLTLTGGTLVIPQGERILKA